MRQSTKDRAKGKAHEVKGGVKEKLSRAAEDHRREAEGKREKEAGIAQQNMADLEDFDNEDLEDVEEE